MPDSNGNGCRRERYQAGVSGVRESGFTGAAEYPKENPRTKSSTTGEDYGVCRRCGNYSHRLSALGYCPDCDKTIENNARCDSDKQYIKVGTRSAVDL